jgi:hypothetical protein
VNVPLPITLGGLVLALAAAVPPAVAQTAKKPAAFPPTLPDGKAVVTHAGDEPLKPPATLWKDVAVAKTAPTVEFLDFAGQDYAGNPWSNWSDSPAGNGMYHASSGDHLAVGKGDGSHGTGTGLLFEYDPEKRAFRQPLNTT